MDEFLVEIEKYKDEFFRYILRNVWDSSVAEDVFSSGVLAAYKSRANFRPGSNFRAWMYKILTNKCFVANREIGRRGTSLDEVQDYLSELAETKDYSNAISEPNDFLDECGDELFMAMKKLSTMERSCLLLKTMGHFSYKELAEMLEIPFGTVMTHLARGRAKLRKELYDYAVEAGIVKEEPIEFKNNQRAAL
jgi:RNA polymerase sigma-70 factor, ECF subfamily